MQTNQDKTVIAAARTSKKKPLTRAEALRELLRDLELRIARIADSQPEDTLQILTLLDQAVELFSELHQVGGVTGSEDSHFETIKAQFLSKRRQFITRIGGTAVLANARQEHHPPIDHWWWFIDQKLAQERRALVKRGLVIGLIIGLLLVGLFVIYQNFWRPDPALQASFGFRTSAENLLTASQFEKALTEVNQALEQTPDAPDLLLLRGVIYEMLEQPERADVDFEIAWEGYRSADEFYSTRAGFYLMAIQPDPALADTETAIELNPDSAISFLRQAQAYEMLGNTEMAMENYQLASEVAERIGNPRILVVARTSLAQLLQSAPLITPEPEE